MDISAETIKKAANGDPQSRETIAMALRDDIYGISLRFLGTTFDAEDATQEILMRILQKLSTFRGDSHIRTWAYRVAKNHLLNFRKSQREVPEPTFESTSAQLDGALQTAEADDAITEPVLVREVKIFCTQGMLICLDRELRLAYILGEILEMEGKEAAEILEVNHATFRKRLSRARSQLTKFMQAKCGLVNPETGCQCSKLVNTTINMGIINPDKPLYATHPTRSALVDLDENVEKIRTAAEVFRSHPDYAAPEAFVKKFKETLKFI